MKKLVLLSMMCGAILFAHAQKSNTSTTNKDVKSNTVSSVKSSKTPVQVKDLQKAITVNIKKYYTDYKILEAYQVTEKNATSFEITVQKGTAKENLFYDKTGKFLRKEIAEKPKTNLTKLTTTSSTKIKNPESPKK